MASSRTINLAVAVQALRRSRSPMYERMSLRLLTDLVDTAARSTYTEFDEQTTLPIRRNEILIVLDGKLRIRRSDIATPAFAMAEDPAAVPILKAGDVYVADPGMLNTTLLLESVS